MNNINVTQLVSISDLQRNYNSLIEKLKNLAGPLVLLRRNKPEAVIVSVADYEELVEKKRLYEEGLALSAINVFEKEKKLDILLTVKKASDLFK